MIQSSDRYRTQYTLVDDIDYGNLNELIEVSAIWHVRYRAKVTMATTAPFLLPSMEFVARFLGPKRCPDEKKDAPDEPYGQYRQYVEETIEANAEAKRQ